MNKRSILLIVCTITVFAIIILSFNIFSKKSCEFDGELKDGITYIDGIYTYTYVDNGKENGWSVELTDKNSTEAVQTPICGKISEKPIISTKNMFNMSKAEKIDVSGFDTSNVIDMSYMFSNTAAKEILGLNTLDTSKVIYMPFMFAKTSVSSIDLSNFNTSNVTNMSNMFESSKATYINVSDFDTKNVINMSAMFYENQCKKLNLANFDITNVKYIKNIFAYTVDQTVYLGTEENQKIWQSKMYGK